MNPIQPDPLETRVWGAWLLIGLLCAGAFGTRAQAADPRPDKTMMVGPEIVGVFNETLDDSHLVATFADRDMTIIDNFAPYVFTGLGALQRWAAGLRQHFRGITDLRYKFGVPQEYSRTGDLAYFSLPTQWTELYYGKPVTEHGAMAFVLVRQGERWLIRDMVWARTDSTNH